MLVVESKNIIKKGAGLFDIAKSILGKASKSAIADKVINTATTANLKRAANSALGKELQKSVLSGVTSATQSATQNAFERLGIPPPTKKRKRKKGTGIVLD